MSKQACNVELRGVVKRYGEVEAVRGVSFEIDSGTLVTLLGPSGCGKTTTLRMIAGLEMASEGQIFIGGEDVTHLSATHRDVSMVFQSYALFPHMSVLENVAYGLTVGGRDQADAREAAERGLQLVGLEGYGGRLPAELSGGQQQRVAVARALVLEPKVLLFDEPLSNLDAKLRRKMREDIRELQQRLGVTAVYVTHDQEEALSVSDRIIVMNQGAVVQDGPPRELYERPASLFISTFIGDATVVDAEVTARDGDDVRVQAAGVELTLPAHHDVSGPCRIAIRPRAICLARTGDGIDGQIAKSTYVGTHMEYTVTTTVGDLFVVDGETSNPYAVGDAVKITLRPEGVAVLPPG